MARRNEDSPFSLHALVEQTARILRNATKLQKKSERKLTKETDLSNKNKIERIASLLRSETKKAIRSKKKKSR